MKIAFCLCALAALTFASCNRNASNSDSTMNDTALAQAASVAVMNAPLQTIPFNRISAIAFSPDGRYLAIGDKDGTVTLLNVQDGSTLKQFRDDVMPTYINAVAFSSDGRWVLSGSGAYVEGAKHVLNAWNITGGERTTVATDDEVGYEIKTIAFSPDNTVLAVGASKGIFLWNASDFTFRQKLHDQDTHCLTFSHDGNTLYSGGYNSLLVWDPRQPGLFRSIKPKCEDVVNLDESPDGHYLLAGQSCYNGGTQYVIDLANKDAVKYDNAYMGGAFFSPDGKRLYSSSGIWETETGRKLAEIKSKDGEVALSPDGGTLAVGTEDGIEFWSLTKKGA